jgi:hypothetical protein
VVPDSFRVVVDGDVVPLLPFSIMSYKHIGTLIVVDADGNGSIIIDPSPVENKLRKKANTSAYYHQLSCYHIGLDGVDKVEAVVKDNKSAKDTRSNVTKVYWYK